MLNLLAIILYITTIAGGTAIIVSSLRPSDREHRCGQCEYDLRGHHENADRCPECGHELSKVGRVGRKYAFGPVRLALGAICVLLHLLAIVVLLAESLRN